MTWLSDSTVSHLREITDWPDFTETRYEILEKLGTGGTATVYLAKDRDLDRNVAIKVRHATPSHERMLKEAQTVARLEHPGILPIHDLGFLPDGRIYYVMKRVKGQRLDDFVHHSPSLAERLRVFLRICEAVAFAHSQGVIHRDLKPGNVMIGDFGEVLVIDWGVDVLGTPGYMAPEQEQGRAGAGDPRTDVYGLGGLLTFLLPEGPHRALLAISRKACAANPADRYASAVEISEEVNRFLGGDRVSAFPESLWETGRRLVLRHRVFVILIVTYVLVRTVLILIGR
jgi:serine/threonine protein kinase